MLGDALRREESLIARPSGASCHSVQGLEIARRTLDIAFSYSSKQPRPLAQPCGPTCLSSGPVSLCVQLHQ